MRATSSSLRSDDGPGRIPFLLPEGGSIPTTARIETSRFCVDTNSAEGRGATAIHETIVAMFAGIVEWSITNGFDEIGTVTAFRFERILSRFGWPLQRLAAPRKIGVTKAVAGTLQASRDMFLRLKPANYSSQITIPFSLAA